MKKGILVLCLCACFYPLESSAWYRPMLSLALGADAVNTHLNQNLTIIAPFQNSYLSGGANFQPVAGLFVGMETMLHNFLTQLGVSYYQNKAYLITGSVYQFADPTLNNLSYQYHIESQRVLVETKVLSTIKQRFHPYFSAGVGEALNQAYQYIETPVSTDDVAMAQGFNNRTYHSFTYQVGLGVEADLTAHWRGGVGYRFIDLGAAGLGATPLQEGSQTIKYNHLHVNELLLQLSYLG